MRMKGKRRIEGVYNEESGWFERGEVELNR